MANPERWQIETDSERKREMERRGEPVLSARLNDDDDDDDRPRYGYMSSSVLSPAMGKWVLWP